MSESDEMQRQSDFADVSDGGGSLPASLDFTQAQPLRDGLAALLARNPELTLDASAVERMSTPCAQLLLAAGRSISATGNFRIVNASEHFRTALVDLGLQSEFSQWMA